MLQTYEATYNGEQFRWINQAPPKLDKEVPVVLVMDVEKTAIKPKKNLHDVLQRTRGAWGKGKTLDEIDAEINETRLQYEEVIAILNFDLMDTVAGWQLHDIGHQKGLIEGAREMLLDVLEERFGIVPNDIIQDIHTVSIRDNLKQLHRQAIRCPNIDGFEEMLSYTKNFESGLTGFKD